MSDIDTKLLPASQVAKRYDVCSRTLARWERNVDLQFPRPVVINKRRYFRESELTAFDRAQVGRRA